jgi:hypothetical protein
VKISLSGSSGVDRIQDRQRKKQLKKNKMKFTFKTNKSTGKYRSFYSDEHVIKLNKKEVGHISDGIGYKISLAIKKVDLNDDQFINCSWKWIKFNKEFITLQEAKNWLNENANEIIKNYKLHLFED